MTLIDRSGAELSSRSNQSPTVPPPTATISLRRTSKEERTRWNTPNSARTKEHATMRACEHALLALCTYVLDPRKHCLFDADLQSHREKGGNRLIDERRTGRDLDVVAQLEVLTEE